MSLVSSFIENQLQKVIEDEILNHSDDVKAVAMQEIQAFMDNVAGWLKDKIEAHKAAHP